MASQKIGKESPEWGIWADLWKMLQEFAIPEDTDAYWGGMVRRAHEIDEKWNGNPLARKGALMIIDYLDYKWRKAKHGTAERES